MAHILLVDDEAAITYVFKGYLERAGQRVTAVAGPGEALAAALPDLFSIARALTAPASSAKLLE